MTDTNTLTITIDGKECTCTSGEILFEVAKRNGIIIPSFCHHEGLDGLGACRVCLVEVIDRGRSSIVISCMYPLEKTVEVRTQSDVVRKHRGVVLELLRKLAPQSTDRVAAMAKANKAPDLERLLARTDGNLKCILCGRCVAACRELGTGAIAAINRGITKEIATPYHDPAQDCIGCLSCVEVCPTGAIAFTEDDDTRTVWERTFALQHCEHCGKLTGTQEQLLYAAAKTALDPDTLCEDCRKQAIANNMRAAFTR